jgi:hypothetical protein
MNGVGHQFLAGAALAVDYHWRLALRRLATQLIHLVHEG